MPTRLILLRHGETDWNVEGRWQGHADVPLNDNGREVARRAAQRFRSGDVDAIHASDLSRAIETARLVAGHLDLEIGTHADLREVALGAWEGLSSDDIAARYQDEWERRQSDPIRHAPPGGERLVDVAARVWAAMDRLARLHAGGRILVVSHGMAIATVLCRLDSLPLERARDLILDNVEHREVHWPTG